MRISPRAAHIAFPFATTAVGFVGTIVWVGYAGDSLTPGLFTLLGLPAIFLGSCLASALVALWRDERKKAARQDAP